MLWDTNFIKHKKHCYQIMSGKLLSEIIYPILCDDLTSLEYRKANYVLSTKNTVTMKQLKEHFSLVSQEVGETST
jgi:hypothetical protein